MTKKSKQYETDVACVTYKAVEYVLVIVGSEKLNMLGPYYIPADNISILDSSITPESHVVIPALMFREALPEDVKQKMKAGKKVPGFHIRTLYDIEVTQAMLDVNAHCLPNNEFQEFISGICCIANGNSARLQICRSTFDTRNHLGPHLATIGWLSLLDQPYWVRKLSSHLKNELRKVQGRLSLCAKDLETCIAAQTRLDKLKSDGV